MGAGSRASLTARSSGFSRTIAASGIISMLNHESASRKACTSTGDLIAQKGRDFVCDWSVSVAVPVARVPGTCPAGATAVVGFRQ